MRKRRKKVPHYGNIKPVNYRAIYEEKFYDILGQLKLPLMITIFVTTLGTLLFMIINGSDNAVNGFFHTVITISTIGYTEGYTENVPLNRFVSSVFIIFAFPLGYMYGLVKTIQVLTQGKIGEIYKYWRMYKEMEKIKDHYIVTPYNAITREIVKDFKRRKIPFILIDQNESNRKSIEEEGYEYFIIDEPHKRAVLLGAFIDRAKGLITAHEENTQDLSVIVTARLIRPDKDSFYIFATATTEGSAEKMRLLGANEVIVPHNTIGKRIVSMVLHPPSPLVSNFLEKIAFGERTDIDITEIHIDESSWIVGKALKDIHLRKNTQTTVVAVVREDGKMDIAPSGDYIVRTGDTLLLLGKPANIEKAKVYLTNPEEV
ncbi:MAG: TrkA C-terminal domain-containing protein [Hydrogenothermaceae bacterium]